jgi:hypothetical protein
MCIVDAIKIVLAKGTWRRPIVDSAFASAERRHPPRRSGCAPE